MSRTTSGGFARLKPGELERMYVLKHKDAEDLREAVRMLAEEFFDAMVMLEAEQSMGIDVDGDPAGWLEPELAKNAAVVEAMRAAKGSRGARMDAAWRKQLDEEAAERAKRRPWDSVITMAGAMPVPMRKGEIYLQTDEGRYVALGRLCRTCEQERLLVPREEWPKDKALQVHNGKMKTPDFMECQACRLLRAAEEAKKTPGGSGGAVPR